MRDELSKIVYPVISAGLELKEKLERGEALSLESEQAALRSLLLPDSEARQWSDYGGEAIYARPAATTSGSDITEARPAGFLGVRYALVCWLDEIFILDSSWAARWNERKLEAAIYSTNDRAWKFWMQAQQAEARPGADALEVFLLAVMLGFRGEMRENPRGLDDWIAATQSRVVRGQSTTWDAPLELDPPTNVPALRGSERFDRMTTAVGIAMLALVGLGAFVVVANLGL